MSFPRMNLNDEHDSFNIDDNDNDYDDVDVEALNIEYSSRSSSRKKNNNYNDNFSSSKNSKVMTAKLLQYPNKSIISKIKKFFTTGELMLSNDRNSTSHSSDALVNNNKNNNSNSGNDTPQRPTGFFKVFLFGGKYLLMSSKMNVLLIFLPLVRFFPSPPLHTFVGSCYVKCTM